MIPSGAKATFQGWWLSKSASDQRIFSAVGVLLVGAIWFGLVWSPLNRARNAARAEIAQIENAEAELALLPSDAGTGLPPGTELRDRLTITAAEQGLEVSGLETRDGRTVLAFETVGFDELAVWLGNIEQKQSVTVISARLQRRPEPGTVSAEIELEER